MNFWLKIEEKKLSMQFLAIILKSTLTKREREKDIKKEIKKGNKLKEKGKKEKQRKKKIKYYLN